MKTEEKKTEGMSFEQAVSRLEKIVGDMESGNADLDAMVKYFEEGQKLVQFCTAKLSEIERKVELLTKSENGKVKAEAFGEG